MEFQKGVKPSSPQELDASQTFVKFVSKDQHEFIVHRDCAKVSKTIRQALAGESSKQDLSVDDNVPGGASGASVPMTRIKLPIKGALLEKVIQYCYYKSRYENNYQTRPEFVVDPAMAMELIHAANYLQC
jgi:hypothetical protein